MNIDSFPFYELLELNDNKSNLHQLLYDLMYYVIGQRDKDYSVGQEKVLIEKVIEAYQSMNVFEDDIVTVYPPTEFLTDHYDISLRKNRRLLVTFVAHDEGLEIHYVRQNEINKPLKTRYGTFKI